MKRILSVALACLMVAATFGALAQSVFATETLTEQQLTPSPLYSENFDDMTGKTAEEILAEAGMTDLDDGAGAIGSLAVTEDGRLSCGASYPWIDKYYTNYGYGNDTQQQIFGYRYNGFIFECDLRFLDYAPDSTGGFAVYAYPHGSSDYENYRKGATNYGWLKKGWFSELAVDGTVRTGAHQPIVDDGGVNLYGENTSTTKFDPSKPLKLRIVFDATTDFKITTYVVEAAGYTSWDADNVIKTESGDLSGHVGSEDTYNRLINGDFSFYIDPGMTVAVDNLCTKELNGTILTYMDAGDNTNNVDANTGAIYGWVCGYNATPMKKIDIDGTKYFTLGNYTSGETEKLLIADNEELKNGFILEYDLEMTSSRENGLSVGFHFGDESDPSVETSWFSRVDWEGYFYSGAETESEWLEQQSAKLIDSGSMNGQRYSFRIIFDPVARTLTTIARQYDYPIDTWEGWPTETVELPENFEDYLTSKLVMTIDSGMTCLIDNIKVTAQEIIPNVFGYQVDTTNDANIRLLGVINEEIFTTADRVGFRVTMEKVNGGAKVTKDIDCNYVYSSITAWGADTPTTAAEMLAGTSHIYALHIKGITEAVKITITAYYVDEEANTRYLGDSTIEFTYTPTTSTM